MSTNSSPEDSSIKLFKLGMKLIKLEYEDFISDLQLNIEDIKKLAEFLTEKQKCFNNYNKIYNFLFESRISEYSEDSKEKGKIKRSSEYTKYITTVNRLIQLYEHEIKIKIKLIINKLQSIYAKKIFGKNSKFYDEIQTEIKRTERVLKNIDKQAAARKKQAALEAARKQTGDNKMCTYHQYIF